jgi:hypothetical protein
VKMYFFNLRYIAGICLKKVMIAFGHRTEFILICQ